MTTLIKHTFDEIETCLIDVLKGSDLKSLFTERFGGYIDIEDENGELIYFANEENLPKITEIRKALKKAKKVWAFWGYGCEEDYFEKS